MQHLFLRS